MSVTFELSQERLSRLRAEAVRRGVSIDEVTAELAPSSRPPNQVAR